MESARLCEELSYDIRIRDIQKIYVRSVRKKFTSVSTEIHDFIRSLTDEFALLVGGCNGPTIILHYDEEFNPQETDLEVCWPVINRTEYSKFALIDLAQENEATRYMPPHLHSWEMFIKPEELEESLKRYGLQNKDVKGMIPLEDPTPFMTAMQEYNAGKISYIELAKCLRTSADEGPFIEGFYMGYAIKP